MGTRWHEVIPFVADTGGGDQVVPLLRHTTEVPKAILIFSASMTADGAGVHYALTLAMATGDQPDQFGIWNESQDAVGTTNSKRKHSAAVGADTGESVFFEHLTADGTDTGSGRIEVAAGSFTVDWAAGDPPASAFLCVALVIGGEGVSAKLLTFDKPLVTGTVDYTGFGFTPVEGETLCFLLGTQLPESDFEDTHLSPNFGVFASATQQGCLTTVSEDLAAAADTYRVCRSADRCMATVGITGSNHSAVKLDSLIAGGAKLDWVVADGVDRHFSMLLISGGGKVAVVGETVTASGTTHTTTGLPFKPGAVLRFGHGTTETPLSGAALTVQNGNEWCFGVSDGISHGAVWFGDNDTSDPTQADRRHSSTLSYMSGAFGTGALDGSLGAPTFTAHGATFPKVAPAADEFTIAVYFEAEGNAGVNQVGRLNPMGPASMRGGPGLFTPVSMGGN